MHLKLLVDVGLAQARRHRLGGAQRRHHHRLGGWQRAGELRQHHRRHRHDQQRRLDNDAAGVIDATGGTLILNTGTRSTTLGCWRRPLRHPRRKDKEINNSGTGTKGIVIDATQAVGRRGFAQARRHRLGGARRRASPVRRLATSWRTSTTPSSAPARSATSTRQRRRWGDRRTGGTLILNTGTTIDNAGVVGGDRSGILDVRTRRSTTAAPARRAS